MTPPVLQTQRLYLSLLTLEDVPIFASYRNDPEIARYQYWYPVTEEAVRDLVEQHHRLPFGTQDQWFQFGIRLIEDQTLIGDIGIHFLDSQFEIAEIGYAISPPYQKQGYAAESVRAIINYCFTSTPLTRIHATCDSRNTTSMHLLEKTGFTQQLIRPNAIFLRGEWSTEVDYAFTREQSSINL
jgi:RimJ/RimL family protein N-acetyltransferase